MLDNPRIIPGDYPQWLGRGVPWPRLTLPNLLSP